MIFVEQGRAYKIVIAWCGVTSLGWIVWGRGGSANVCNGLLLHGTSRSRLEVAATRCRRLT